MSKLKKGSRTNRNQPVKPFASFWLLYVRNYKFGLVIVTLAAVLSICERTRPNTAQNQNELKPEWILDRELNLPDVLMELYPNRIRAHYIRGYQAALCFDNRYSPEFACDQFRFKNLHDVRIEFQRALALGEKSNEHLLHEYCYLLIRLGADKEYVDEAVRNWRINFPYSSNPVPTIRSSNP